MEHTLVRFEVTLDSHESSVSGSASADEQRIERSPADVLRLLVAVGVALALLLVEWLFGDALVDFASELLRGLDAVPVVDLRRVRCRDTDPRRRGARWGADLGARGETVADAGDGWLGGAVGRAAGLFAGVVGRP